jgi:3',5'-cyclic AMP phosphodiesterase CpdA
VIVAQITDMHIKRRGHVLHHMPHVAQPLRRVLTSIADLRPAPYCIIATGDLTESGSVAEFARLREILNDHAEIPIYLLPGNHDRCEALRNAFWDHEYLRDSRHGVLYTIEMPSLRIVALDSTDERRAGGFLSEARLEWLRRRLWERRNTPTILAMHHPPFPTGVGPFDRQPFQGREDLGAIARMHPQILRIICGHVHQPLAKLWHGTLCVTAPSTAPTLVVHPRAPRVSWEPGGFLLHRYEQHAGLTTTLFRIAAKPVALTA